jgi:hypothetical protein
VNIGTLADNDGAFVPYPDLNIEVTYRRPQAGWNPLQRSLHSWHQQTPGRATDRKSREGRRSARNRATTQEPITVLASEAAAPTGSATSQAATTPTGGRPDSRPRNLTHSAQQNPATKARSPGPQAGEVHSEHQPARAVPGLAAGQRAVLGAQ